MSNIFEEMRADRAQRAEIRRADRAAERDQDRADRREKQARAEQRRNRRQARTVGVVRWLAGHPVDLLMVVIIVVPALLAWTAMAVYGRQLYGVIGVLLPLFTEAAMWAFAFKLHAARRAGQSTGWLVVGTWTFTAVAAGLNYVHGQVQGGWSVGVVMAVVSTGGVIAHQIITAAPMRPRHSRTERAMAKRVARMQRAAVRHAVGELAADGTIRLLYRPGVVALRRGWRIRLRLVHTGIPGMADDGPADRSVADALGAEAQAWLAEQEATGHPTSIDPDGPRSIQTRSTQDRPVPESTEDQQKSTRNRGVIPEPARRSIDELRAELRAAVEQALPLDQGKPIDPSNAESIRRALRCAPKTARLLRDEWNDGTAGLPVG